MSHSGACTRLRPSRPPCARRFRFLPRRARSAFRSPRSAASPSRMRPRSSPRARTRSLLFRTCSMRPTSPRARAPMQNSSRMKTRSEDLFERALKCIPAGVNSPVRAFGAVGGTPVFFERASGAYLWDAEGRRYVDYVGSWGPMVAGHTHPKVVEAVQAAAARALSFGAPTEAEVELADAICRLVP